MVAKDARQWHGLAADTYLFAAQDAGVFHLWVFGVNPTAVGLLHPTDDGFPRFRGRDGGGLEQ